MAGKYITGQVGTIQINDVVLPIDPTSIKIFKSSKVYPLQLMRARKTGKLPTKDTRIIVNLQLAFNGLDQIYGELKHLIDGFDCTPLAYVDNQKLRNEILGSGEDRTVTMMFAVDSYEVSWDGSFPRTAFMNLSMSFINYLPYVPYVEYLDIQSDDKQALMRPVDDPIKSSLWKAFVDAERRRKDSDLNRTDLGEHNNLNSVSEGSIKLLLKELRYGPYVDPDGLTDIQDDKRKKLWQQFSALANSYLAKQNESNYTNALIRQILDEAENLSQLPLTELKALIQSLTTEVGFSMPEGASGVTPVANADIDINKLMSTATAIAQFRHFIDNEGLTPLSEIDPLTGKKHFYTKGKHPGESLVYYRWREYLFSNDGEHAIPVTITVSKTFNNSYIPIASYVVPTWQYMGSSDLSLTIQCSAPAQHEPAIMSTLREFEKIEDLNNTRFRKVLQKHKVFHVLNPFINQVFGVRAFHISDSQSSTVPNQPGTTHISFVLTEASMDALETEIPKQEHIYASAAEKKQILRRLLEYVQVRGVGAKFAFYPQDRTPAPLRLHVQFIALALNTGADDLGYWVDTLGDKKIGDTVSQVPIRSMDVKESLVEDIFQWFSSRGVAIYNWATDLLVRLAPDFLAGDDANGTNGRLVVRESHYKNVASLLPKHILDSFEERARKLVTKKFVATQIQETEQTSSAAVNARARRALNFARGSGIQSIPVFENISKIFESHKKTVIEFSYRKKVLNYTQQKGAGDNAPSSGTREKTIKREISPFTRMFAIFEKALSYFLSDPSAYGHKDFDDMKLSVREDNLSLRGTGAYRDFPLKLNEDEPDNVVIARDPDFYLRRYNDLYDISDSDLKVISQIQRNNTTGFLAEFSRHFAEQARAYHLGLTQKHITDPRSLRDINDPEARKAWRTFWAQSMNDPFEGYHKENWPVRGSEFMGNNVFVSNQGSFSLLSLDEEQKDWLSRIPKELHITPDDRLTISLRRSATMQDLYVRDAYESRISELDKTQQAIATAVAAEMRVQFVSPLPGASVTSPFGPRSNENSRYKDHNGVDLAVRRPWDKHPVCVAAISGIVKLNSRYGKEVPNDPSDTNAWDSGKHLWIISRNGRYKVGYAHLHEILVEDGQFVNAGDSVGLVGNSWRGQLESNLGVHLHFTVRVRNDADQYVPIDPESVIDFTGRGTVPRLDTFMAESEYGSEDQVKAGRDAIVNNQALFNSAGFNRAYPAFKLYFIEEDSINGEQHLLGYDDFFSAHAVHSIDVYRDIEFAADTAVITLSNLSGIFSHRWLDRLSPEQLEKAQFLMERVEENAEKLVQDTGEENTLPFFPLAQGVKVAIQLGYSNDPEKLETVFVGVITSVTPNRSDDVLTITAQSYGIELVQSYKGIEEPEERDGWIINDAETIKIFQYLLSQPEVKHFGRWDPSNPLLNTTTFAGNDLTTWRIIDRPSDVNIFQPVVKAKDLSNVAYIIDDLDYYIYRTQAWDVFKEMTLRHPGMICYHVPYMGRWGPRATLFFGLPDTPYVSRDLTANEHITLVRIKQSLDSPKTKEFIKQSALRYHQALARPVIESLNRGEYISNMLQRLKPLSTEIVEEVIPNWIFAEEKLKFWKNRGIIKPFRNYHLISSFANLISNDIKLSTEKAFNCVHAQYSDEISGFDDSTQTFELDDPAVYTLKANATLEPHELRELFINYPNCVEEELGRRYACSTLWRTLKNSYQGSLVLLGNPAIKPTDVCFLYDEYTDMVGPVEVKSVHHSFSADGFITTIEPRMIVNVADIATMTTIDVMGSISAYIANQLPFMRSGSALAVFAGKSALSIGAAGFTGVATEQALTAAGTAITEIAAAAGGASAVAASAAEGFVTGVGTVAVGETFAGAAAAGGTPVAASLSGMLGVGALPVTLTVALATLAGGALLGWYALHKVALLAQDFSPVFITPLTYAGRPYLNMTDMGLLGSEYINPIAGKIQALRESATKAQIGVQLEMAEYAVAMNSPFTTNAIDLWQRLYALTGGLSGE